jgi:hypothetical protein
MNILGKAYRNQAMELISICRVFSISRGAEKISEQDAKLSEVLQACDNALALTAAEGKKRTLILDQRIKMVIRKLHEYEREFHPGSTDRVEGRMRDAMDKDEKESAGVKLFHLPLFKTHRTRPEETSSRDVRFHLLTSVTDTQPIVVQQVLTSSNVSEILWNFNRYPPDSKKRITLAKNPHFYHPQSLNEYWDGFTAGPMEDYQYANDIYVLTNTPSRIFLEFGEDSQAFDNVWQTNRIFIFKSISGKLEGELRVRQLLLNSSWEWCHEEPLPSQQQARSAVHPPNPRSTTTRSSTTDTPAWIRVNDWTVPLYHVLYSQYDNRDTKIRIRILSNRTPSRSKTVPR